MSSTAAEVAAVARLATGALVWGAEVDLSYRVLAVTIEPGPQRHPEGEVDDRRLQILLHPVTRIAAAWFPAAATAAQPFEVDELLDVVTQLDGPTAEVGLTPTPGAWAREPSFQGTSRALDGLTHGIVWRLDAADGARLHLHVTFDEVEVKDPTGRSVALTGP